MLLQRACVYVWESFRGWCLCLRTPLFFSPVAFNRTQAFRVSLFLFECGNTVASVSLSLCPLRSHLLIHSPSKLGFSPTSASTSVWRSYLILHGVLASERERERVCVFVQVCILEPSSRWALEVECVVVRRQSLKGFFFFVLIPGDLAARGRERKR